MTSATDEAGWVALRAQARERALEGTRLIDLLTPLLDHKHDPTYGDVDIREWATFVVNLEGGGLLAVRQLPPPDDLLVSFVVFQWSSKYDGMEWYERLFHGEGPSGNLRELRHTFWGEQDNGGYIFCPPGKLIADAMKQLERWFDVG